MILLITPSARAQDCAKALHERPGKLLRLPIRFVRRLGHLRTQEFSAVVIDQSFLETEPDESETVLEHIGTAIPVHINLAISGMERLIREIRAALYRRKKEGVLARQGAQQALRNELKGTVTALLLSCEMALQAPNLETSAEAKMRALYELAQQMRAKLEVSA
jgi:hypothetical protein